MSRDDDYKFGKRGGACSGCGGALRQGAEAVSALYLDGASFSRRDFCGPCFQDAARRGSPFSWWSAVVPVPEQRKAVFDLGMAREFLLRLLRDDDPARASLRYLLVLMLMRKRVVVVVGQEERLGAEVMTVRLPPDETLHEVAAVEIDEEESLRLRDEIGRLFDLGPAGSGTPAAAPPDG
ncbi:MAG: hypothetical protein HMLKMBBP_02145 [Planctomycetes bacterium]|nr:hypothetical protein [Planctomycetota bacterium]